MLEPKNHFYSKACASNDGESEASSGPLLNHTAPIYNVIGRCPECGGSVVHRDDSFICTQTEDDDCTFCFSEDEIKCIFIENIANIVLDSTIGNNEDLQRLMIGLLGTSEKQKVDWHKLGHRIYECLEMQIVRNIGGTWFLQVTRDNAGLTDDTKEA